MATPYSQANQNFSNQAHEAAQRLIYPYVFNAVTGTDIDLEFESTSLGTSDRATILDGQMAVDRIVRVYNPGFNAPLEFTVQERFRRTRYAAFKDITITEWNHAHNVKSELYKLNAGLFVYGYFDQETKTFLDWIVVDTTKMLVCLNNGEVTHTLDMNPRSDQTFIGLKFQDLRDAGLVISERKSIDFRRREMDVWAFQTQELLM